MMSSPFESKTHSIQPEAILHHSFHQVGSTQIHCNVKWGKLGLLVSKVFICAMFHQCIQYLVETSLFSLSSIVLDKR
jgi:hypothetical protein